MVPDGANLTEYRTRLITLADNPDQIPEDASDEFISAVYALRNRRENLEKTQRIEGARTPRGIREELLGRVATWASKRYKAPISARFVEACVEEFRELRATHTRAKSD